MDGRYNEFLSKSQLKESYGNQVDKSLLNIMGNNINNNKKFTNFEKCINEINKKINNKKNNRPEIMLKEMVSSELNKK
jgi:hypothetical protein